MPAPVRPFPAFPHRLKALIIVALVMLALGTGVVGTTTPVSAARRQPKVACTYFTQEHWIYYTSVVYGVAEDPGPGGYWDCNFV